jgi:hypothetical protein
MSHASPATHAVGEIQVTSHPRQVSVLARLDASSRVETLFIRTIVDLTLDSAPGTRADSDLVPPADRWRSPTDRTMKGVVDRVGRTGAPLVQGMFSNAGAQAELSCLATRLLLSLLKRQQMQCCLGFEY